MIESFSGELDAWRNITVSIAIALVNLMNLDCQEENAPLLPWSDYANICRHSNPLPPLLCCHAFMYSVCWRYRKGPRFRYSIQQECGTNRLQFCGSDVDSHFVEWGLRPWLWFHAKYGFREAALLQHTGRQRRACLWLNDKIDREIKRRRGISFFSESPKNPWNGSISKRSDPSWGKLRCLHMAFNNSPNCWNNDLYSRKTASHFNPCLFELEMASSQLNLNKRHFFKSNHLKIKGMETRQTPLQLYRCTLYTLNTQWGLWNTPKETHAISKHTQRALLRSNLITISFFQTKRLR